VHRLTEVSLRHPAWTLILCALFCVVAGAGAMQLRSETGYRAALGAEHPAVRGLDAFIADFGGGLPVQVAWSCDGIPDCTHPLSEDRLLAAERIAEAVRHLPGVKAVHTPGDTPVLVAQDGAIEARRLLVDGSTSVDLDALVRRAAADPLWQGVLISEDSRTAALLIEIESSDPDLYAATVNTLLEAVKKEGGAGYALVGDPIDFVLGGASLNWEAKRLGAVAALLVALTVWILFRRPLAVVPALAAVGIAGLGCLGLMGWLGWPENEISQAIVPLLLVIGIGEGLFFLSRYRDLADAPEGSSTTRADLLLAAAKDVGFPCFITSTTTAAGLISFGSSELAGFVRFGITSATGILIALVATFTLFPVLVNLLRLDLPKLEASRGWVRALEVLTAGTERHALAIVVGTVVLLAGAGWGLTLLRVDVTKESLLGSQSPIVKWQHWVAEHLRKPDSLEVRLTLPEGTLLAEPTHLGKVDEVVTLLEEEPRLGRSRSVLDGVKRMNELIHDEDPAMRRLGQTQDQNEQLLLALDSYDRRLVDTWLTLDRKDLRISVEADLLSKEERGALLADLRTGLESRLPEGWSYEFTGPLPVFNAMVSALHATEIRSFTTSAVLVWLLVALSLGSLTAAVWVMIPTVFPVAVTLGAMGFVGIPLDTGTAMVASVVIGIAVDNSIHLVTWYRRRLGNGEDRAAAMRGAIAEVGRPVVASALSLSAGFLVMLLSSWGAIAAFGLLSACAILVSLVTNLFLLPAILFLMTRRQGETRTETTPSESPDTGRGIRLMLLLLSAGSGLLLYAAIGAEVLGTVADRRALCAPLENGFVPLSAALAPDCPLRPFEIIRRPSHASGAEAIGTSVTFLARRGSGEGPVEVPVFHETPRSRAQAFTLLASASFLFLGICLTVAWKSSAAAATPLVLASTAAVALASSAALSPWSMWAARAGVIGLALLPGALLHLALTFPSRRALMRGTPRLPLLIYGWLLLPGIAAIFSFLRVPELFAFVAQLLMALSTLAAAGVLIGAVSAVRRSSNALHRQRGRVLLVGLLAVAMAGLGLQAVTPRWIDALPGGRAGALALTMLFGLLPVAYAVHRYHLFDARAHAAAGLRVAAQAACFVTLVVVFESVVSTLVPPPAGMALAAFGAWAGTELLDQVLWERLRRRGQKRLQQMGELGALHARRTSALSAQSELARQIRETLVAARQPRFVTVFLKRPSGWYPADASGGGPTEEEVAALASQVAFGEGAVYLGEEEATAEPVHDTLRAAGVETLLPLGEASRRFGVVILGAAPEPLSSRDREFLEYAARQTAASLSWAEAAEQISHAGALARRGFLAASLTHDLGKPFSTIWSVARSALQPGRSPREVEERLHDIQEAADHGLAIVDRLFQPGPIARAEAYAPAGEVVTLACQEAERIQGHPIRMRFGEDLPDIATAFELHEALTALLANACRESPPDVPVEVSVSTLRDGALQIEVLDHGSGMDEETQARAFDPWFTRRSDRGGRGLGLTLCRLLVRQRGGDVQIVESRPGKGTRMRIVLPAHAPVRGEA
jgi:hypothetical protein